MKRTTLFLPEQLKKKIDDMANERGIGFSEMVRYILFEKVEDDKND